MTDILELLTPPDGDLRDMPVPLDMLIELAVKELGMSAVDAEARARQVAAESGIPLGEIGHG